MRPCRALSRHLSLTVIMVISLGLVIQNYYSDSVEDRAKDQFCCETLGKHHLHRAVYSLCVTGHDKNKQEWREDASLFYIILSVGRL